MGHIPGTSHVFDPQSCHTIIAGLSVTRHLGHSKLSLVSGTTIPSYTMLAGGWLRLQDYALQCNIMPFVAAVTFVMYQKVHLLLDDITTWRVMKAVWEVCESNAQNFVLFSRTTHKSFPPRIHADNCIVLINCIMKHRHRRRTRNE